MPELRLYNTLTRRKDVFTPADPSMVKMYCCGPTVYNYAHIGNLRTYLFEDLLKRVMIWRGWGVRHVMNITDVGHMTSDADTGEDKMMKAAAREHRSPWEIARFYEAAFFNDIGRLNILPPTVATRATEYISQMIALVSRLEERGFTYRTSEGVYFNTALDADYGKLANLDFAGQRQGARDEVNIDKEKKHPSDFILWFSNKPNHIMQWESPWGRGYPGWHIECSAMSMDQLGETLDIHCGGIDHIPVHNTNEIAQSECATGKQFARFWLHGAFLNIKGTEGPGHVKMAKSGDNFLTVDRLVEAGFDPLSYRYLGFTAHYRSELTFSWEALEAARTALRRIYDLRAKVGEDDGGAGLSEAEYAEARSDINEALCDDLNAPRALATLHQAGSYKLWKEYDSILGLDIASRSRVSENTAVPEEVTLIVAQRDQARSARDFALSDKLRNQLVAMGYEVGDTPRGTTLRLIK
jgi:cysteinyl-tRNA synthetase